MKHIEWCLVKALQEAILDVRNDEPLEVVLDFLERTIYRIRTAKEGRGNGKINSTRTVKLTIKQKLEKEIRTAQLEERIRVLKKLEKEIRTLKGKERIRVLKKLEERIRTLEGRKNGAAGTELEFVRRLFYELFNLIEKKR